MTPETNKGVPKRYVIMGMKGVALAAILVGLLMAVKYFNLQQVFRDALAWIEGAGPIGPLVFFGLYIAACVFMLPGSILTLGAGAVFGVVIMARYSSRSLQPSERRLPSWSGDIWHGKWSHAGFQGTTHLVE